MMDTKLIFGYNFVAPLIQQNISLVYPQFPDACARIFLHFLYLKTQILREMLINGNLGH